MASGDPHTVAPPGYSKETREKPPEQFDSAATELVAACYPIETVTSFHSKTTEAQGWQEIQPPPDFLLRRACIISFPSAILYFPSSPLLARVTYTGGYVLPGTTPSPGQTKLPDDLEQAAYWFQNRDHLGLKTLWIHEGDYHQFLALPLLPEVRATRKPHQRWTI